MNRARTSGRGHRLYLDFDGSGWIRRVPISRFSPWPELIGAAFLGFWLGLEYLPTPAPVTGLGWMSAGLLSPVFVVVGALPLLHDGTWHWPLTPDLTAALGWSTASLVTADAIQASSPLSFPWRATTTAAAGPALAVGFVTAASQVPWDRLANELDRLA